MKISKTQFIIGFIVIAAVSYGLWTMQNNKLPEEIAALNTKYNLIEASPLIEEGENRSFASLMQANSFQSYKADPNKEAKDLIIKLDSSDNSKLEDLVILKLQTDAEIEEVSKEYEKVWGIKYAEPDYEIEITSSETSEAQEIKKSLIEKSAPKSTIIALIDSGVDTTHPALVGKLIDGRNFFNNKKISDESGHGTHIAGILAEKSSSASIMPIKFTDGTSAKLSNLIKSIKFATDNEADVINLSLGLIADPQSLKESISYATDKHILIVAAAGNNNSDIKYFPAAWPNVFAVAALDDKNEKTYISNYGDWIDFSALGQDVYSTAPGNKYTYKTGTSQAAPAVSAKLADFISTYTGDIEDLFDEAYSYLEKNSTEAEGEYSEKLGKAL